MKMLPKKKKTNNKTKQKKTSYLGYWVIFQMIKARPRAERASNVTIHISRIAS